MIRRWPEGLAWLAALAVAATALAALDYQVRDPDSILYADIGARLAAEPFSSWIAPTWPPGSYRSGLFQEHPAGLFVLPAVLTRLGYPGAQAAFLAGAFYQAIALMLIPAAAAVFAEASEARALGWILQLLPIAFTFRVRANHEPAVLLFFVIALPGVERVVEGRRGGTLVLAGGLVGLMLFKGLLVVPAFLCCVLWALARTLPEGAPRPGARRAAWSLAAALALLVLTAALYEHLYREATSQSFVAGYFGRSLSVGSSEGHDWTPATIPYNVAFYSGRVLWFAFPWSLALAAAAWTWLRRGPSEGSPTSPGLLFALGTALVYVGLFSLSTRRAERYIFPAYFVVGAAGAVVALRHSPRLRAVAHAAERIEPYAPPLLWLLLFGLHLAGGGLGVPHIQIWNP